MIDEIRVKFNYVRILNNTRTARPRERDSGKYAEYVGLSSSTSRQLLRNNKYFWIKHDLDFGQVQRVDDFIDEAYSKATKKTPGWINNKSQVLDFLTKGKNWQNGKVFEVLVENYVKKKYLNPNTEVILSVDIKFIKANGIEVSTKSIQEVDFIIINKSTNKIEQFGSIKMNKDRHTYEWDRNKITDYWYNLPDGEPNLTTYRIEKGLTSKALSFGTSAKINGQNLLTGLPFEEIPSVFRNKILTNQNYTVDKFIKIDLETINLTAMDIAESAYPSLKTKF